MGVTHSQAMLFVAMAGISVCCIPLRLLLRVLIHKRAVKMRRAGFEYLVPLGSSGTKSNGSCFYRKDGVLYYNRGTDPLKAKAIDEVLGAAEIRRNTRLAALEIRLRIDGDIVSVREKGTDEILLALKDKLGFNCL